MEPAGLLAPGDRRARRGALPAADGAGHAAHGGVRPGGAAADWGGDEKAGRSRGAGGAAESAGGRARGGGGSDDGGRRDEIDHGGRAAAQNSCARGGSEAAGRSGARSVRNGAGVAAANHELPRRGVCSSGSGVRELHRDVFAGGGRSVEAREQLVRSGVTRGASEGPACRTFFGQGDWRSGCLARADKPLQSIFIGGSHDEDAHPDSRNE
mmetsp:Transcript_25426/g.64034  ORF Transcript_25426/g.64034 Transcript_25426/m.64034 type:complete len:211 (-) Transcript_25426:148-780(-)